MPTYGYAGKVSRVDLSSRKVAEASILDYAGDFLGGRGLAARVYWDEVSPEGSAFDAGNRLIFATGPLGGIPTIAGSRWQVCGKAPGTPEHFSYANLGGRWGAELKFSGYDSIVVSGRSDRPVYLLVHGGRTEFRDASALWGRGAIETRDAIKREMGNNARVVAIGPAGENQVTAASLLADNDSSGCGGLGTTMGSKNLKAIAVVGDSRGVEVAQPDQFKELRECFRQSGRNFWEYLSRWVRDPLHEFKFPPGPEMKKDPCFGCLGRCPRKVYEAANGDKGKFFCGAAMYYQPWSDRYYGDWNENPNDVPFYATKLCDSYGIDVFAMDRMLSWLHGCHEAGVITEESTGIPLSRIGSLEFIETLLRKIAFREGFGDLLAQGLNGAAAALGPEAERQAERAGYQAEPGLYPWYGPKLYITNALLHAMEPRTPMQQVHEVSFLLAKWATWVYGLGYVSSEDFRAIARRFWGSDLAGDFSTYDGKALAARMIQDRQYAKECLILCDFLWPVTDLEHTEGHMGDPTLESRLLSAVTGREVDEQGLYDIGARVFNLQRAILAREGHAGREFDRLPEACHTDPIEYDHANPECIAPGKDGEPISMKGSVLDREAFERMKSEYYGIRGWDVASGLQTRASLEQLQLKDVADDLEQRGLLARGSAQPAAANAAHTGSGGEP